MMKYLVNRETKEHQIASEIVASSMERYPGFAQDWQLVEADDEGWIPWSGGECPLPDECKCQIELQDGERPLPEPSRRWEWARNIGEFTIAAYRPILSETAEKEEPRRHGRTIAYIPETPANVFDRLKSAIAASESIPAIIAEIDAMLPDGYCVAKRNAVKDVHIEGIGGVTLTAQPGEDMSDWRNWREGDLITYDGDTKVYHWWTEGRPYVVKTTIAGLSVVADDGEAYSIDGKRIARTSRFRFHSRPAKGSV